MKEALVEGEALSKQRESVWRGRGGGSFAMAIPLEGAIWGDEALASTDRQIETLKSYDGDIIFLCAILNTSCNYQNHSFCILGEFIMITFLFFLT